MSYSLGVDLGATTCSAAFRRGAQVEPCALGELGPTMPAVVLPRADGSMLVGEAADHRSRFEPTLVARTVAAHLADPAPVVVDGRPCDPYSLAEALVGTVVQRAADGGEWPGQLVLTYPLRNGGGAEAVLEHAAGRVSTGPVMLVPEPIAAMAKLAHDVELALDTTVAVVDFGGSSFDVTLVRRTETGFDLIGEPASLPDFGGVDVDAAVLAHVESAIGDVTTGVRDDDTTTMLGLRRLRASCRAAKEMLSTAHEAVVEVALPQARAQVQVTRHDLERGIAPALTGAVDLIATTILDAGLAVSDVHVALVVGGSSRIPLLSQLIAERIALPIVADPQPELTVGLGAALFGDEDPAPASPLAAPAPMDVPLAGALAAADLGAPGPEGWPGDAPWAQEAGWDPTSAAPPAAPAWDPLASPEPATAAVGWDPTAEADAGWDAHPVQDNGGWPAATGDDGWPPGPEDRDLEPPGDGWDPAWEDSRTSVFDRGPDPGNGAAAPGGPLVGHASDGADEAFSRLTTSDTDPFGTRSGTLGGRIARRPLPDDGDADDDERPGGGFGGSTDPRVVVGAIGAGLAIVLLGGFALAAGTGGGKDSGGIAVGDEVVSTTTTTMLSTTASTAASTTASSAEDTTTTTRPRSTTTTTTRPRATTTSAPPPTDPPTTTPPTTPPSTDPTTTTTTTTPPTSTTTSTTPGP
jgi:molecular chaperone DnaK